MYTEGTLTTHLTGSVVHCAEDAANIGIQVEGYFKNVFWFFLVQGMHGLINENWIHFFVLLY